MKHTDVEANIREAFEAVVPDLKKEILSDLNSVEIERSLRMTEKRKKNRTWMHFAAVAAALLLLAGAGFAIQKMLPNKANPAVASVMIDVNPSIELAVSSDETVVSAMARNSDGEMILKDMDLAGSNITVAVNAIIGSMVRSGYLSDKANSILITVDGDDASFMQHLSELLVTDAGNMGYAVLSQTLVADPKTDALAEEYGITKSKVQLIRRLMEANPSYSFSDLAALTINELGLLAGSHTVADVQEYGKSSDQAYIGETVARAIALKHAGVSESGVGQVRTEMEYERGRMVYEIEFMANGVEYHYEIDAVTGEIVKAENEQDDANDPDDDDDDHDDDDDDVNPAQAGEAKISSGEALSIALSRAGISKDDAKNARAKLDRENGKLVYEVEFDANGAEYDYEIDAVTGAVSKAENEPDDDLDDDNDRDDDDDDSDDDDRDDDDD